MGPADTLSHLANPDTSSDNTGITLLPDDLFICTIDTALVDKITSFTTSDPLVLNALKSLSTGSPLFPCSSLANWHFSDSCLYLKNCLYIPPDVLLATGGSFAHTPYCPVTTVGWVCPLLFATLSLAAPFASK